MTDKHTLVPEILRSHVAMMANLPLGMSLAEWNIVSNDILSAATRITALEAEKAELVGENARLREAIARLANSINIVGSPYHRAQEALDELVSEVKQAARATLAKARQSEGEGQ